MGTVIAKLEAGMVLWVCGRRRSFMDQVMISATRLGDGPLWGVLAPLMIAFSGRTGRALAAMATAFALEQAIYQVVKRVTTRLRPFASVPGVTRLVIPPDEFSFPSGHTAAAFVMVVFAHALLPALVVPLLAIASLIGISRVYLGVHFPSDVLAGVVLGLLSGSAGLLLL